VVFQDLRLFPGLDVAGNVAFGLAARGVRRGAARQQAVAALAELGAGHLATRQVKGLSGGEAQRVALARALVIQPRVLLLDEPLAALDVTARADMRTLLRRVLPTMDGPRLVVTHDAFEAMALADYLVVLDGGRIVQQGATDAVRQSPQTRFVADLVGLNMLRGVLRRDASTQQVEGRDGVLSVATDILADGQAVLAVFAPNAVTLSAERPAGSARNVMLATVHEVVTAGGRARIRLDSRPPMAVDVTPASVVALNLAPGTTVWASVKATEIRVEPV
jgi:molybdate transport system ATP-binding protein